MNVIGMIEQPSRSVLLGLGDLVALSEYLLLLINGLSSVRAGIWQDLYNNTYIRGLASGKIGSAL